MESVWKPVQGYEHSYKISNTGRVKSIDRLVNGRGFINRLVKSRPITEHINNFGYITVKLSNKGKTKTRLVHRLVAEAFIPNPNNLPEVNHKSGVKTDNGTANLEWISHSKNVQHSYDSGLNSHKKGNHSFAVGVIDNELGKTYTNIKDWCEARKINYSTGRNILSGCNTSRKIDLSKVILLKKTKN